MNKLIQYIFIYVNIDINAAYQTGKKTETAVREAGVSRDHGDPIGVTSETPRTIAALLR